ncbi:peptidyl-prolyl cis-trans isomerase FKBP62-like protein [Tanacetum coccineum]
MVKLVLPQQSLPMLFNTELLSWLSVKDIFKDGCIFKKIVKEGEKWENSNDLDEVIINYDVRLEDGTLVAKSEGVEFKVEDDHFCLALSKAVKTMKKGEKVILTVKPECKEMFITELKDEEDNVIKKAQGGWKDEYEVSSKQNSFSTQNLEMLNGDRDASNGFSFGIYSPVSARCYELDVVRENYKENDEDFGQEALILIIRIVHVNLCRVAKMFTLTGTNLTERFCEQFSPMFVGQKVQWSINTTVIRMPISSKLIKDVSENGWTEITELFANFMKHALEGAEAGQRLQDNYVICCIKYYDYDIFYALFLNINSITIKGLAPDEFAARNYFVQALPDRNQAIPDGGAAAPKLSGGGWAASASRTNNINFDSGD